MKKPTNKKPPSQANPTTAKPKGEIHPVEIYYTSTCPYCLRALGLLRQRQIAFTGYDVGLDPAKRVEMEERTKHLRSTEGTTGEGATGQMATGEVALGKMSGGSEVLMGARSAGLAESGNDGLTVPQIFINGKAIGGCEELLELDRNGGLDSYLPK